MTDGTRARTAWLRAGTLAVVAIAADQLTKHLIADHITPGQTRHVLPGLQFVHTMNDGVAFGITLGDPAVVLVAIFLVLAVLVAYFARRPTRPLLWLPTGLVLGGALSNIYDRLRDGSVTDFIKLPLGWPPFNVADMCVTVGVILLALMIEGGLRGGPAERGAGGRDARGEGARTGAGEGGGDGDARAPGSDGATPGGEASAHAVSDVA